LTEYRNRRQHDNATDDSKLQSRCLESYTPELPDDYDVKLARNEIVPQYSTIDRTSRNRPVPKPRNLSSMGTTSYLPMDGKKEEEDDYEMMSCGNPAKNKYDSTNPYDSTWKTSASGTTVVGGNVYGATSYDPDDDLLYKYDRVVLYDRHVGHRIADDHYHHVDFDSSAYEPVNVQNSANSCPMQETNDAIYSPENPTYDL